MSETVPEKPSDDERGGSFYDRPGMRDAYLAHRHATVSSPNRVMEEPAFMQALGSIDGLHVLDLGCGDGTFARQAIELGAASYRGIDGSIAMIERAKARNGGNSLASGKVEFEQLDMEDLDNLTEGGRRDTSETTSAYDVITARMALHYVADLDAVLTVAASLLGPNGRMLFTVVHPVITAAGGAPTADAGGPRSSQLVDRYFEPGPRRLPWFGSEVTWHHRTIEEYVTAVLRRGLRLTELSECAPVASLFAGNHAEYERRKRVPLMLLVGAQR